MLVPVSYIQIFSSVSTFNICSSITARDRISHSTEITLFRRTLKHRDSSSQFAKYFSFSVSRFEVLTAVAVKSTAFPALTPRCLVKIHRLFRRVYWLNLPISLFSLLFDLEGGGSVFLRSGDNLLSEH